MSGVSARDVYQLFRDVALEQKALRPGAGASWSETDTGAVHVCIDAHRIALFKEAGELQHCLGCVLEDGRRAGQEAWISPGTDPLELLSVWERSQLLKRLQQL